MFKAVGAETLLVAVCGLGFGLAANALSPRGLRLSRNYFPEAPAASFAPAFTEFTTKAPPSTVANARSSSEQRLGQRGLQLIAFNEVVELFRDPRYEHGLVVFIDARDDRNYATGHIAGAWQFHHYRAEKYLPSILPACLIAMRIVVYCSGGDCEDSALATLVLRDAGVPRENLFVYVGGIAEWTANGQPLETGSHRRGPMIPAKP